MSNPQTLAPLESDYEAIEAAVMETEKGRWFLAEYARRHRSADTVEVLAAISNLERMMKRERRPDADRIRLDIGEMKDAIERTKLEIAQIKTDGRTDGSRFDNASNELDAIVTQTESATSEILTAAEKIQEYAWTMREAGVDEEICSSVEDLTTTIYTACSFQDLTGQRTQKVVHVLRYLEHRIDTMIDIWGMEDGEVAAVSSSSADLGPVLDTRPDAHLLNGPALEGQGIAQDRIDDLMFDPAGPAAEAAAADLFEGFDPVDTSPDTGNDAGNDTGTVDPDGDASPAQASDAADLDALERAAAEAAALKPPPLDQAGTEVEETYGEAEMDEAIEALKEVGARGRAALPDDVEDPFEKMTKTERQALFS